MLVVNDVKWSETLSFRLGALGALVADQYAKALAVHDLKPKHVGLLGVLDSGLAASQLEIAQLLRVAPSLVVSSPTASNPWAPSSGSAPRPTVAARS